MCLKLNNTSTVDLESTSHLKWACILFCYVFNNMIWLHGALGIMWGFLPSPEDYLVREWPHGWTLITSTDMVVVLPWLLSSGGGSILPSIPDSIFGQRVLLQCLLKYIYSLYTIQIITTPAVMNSTAE